MFNRNISHNSTEIQLNNETITLDKNEVFKNPKNAAIEWLQQYKERKNENLPLQTLRDAVRPRIEETQRSEHALRSVPLV